MLTILQQGGWVLWMIIVAGAFAAVIFLERAFHLHRAKIKSADFLKGVFNILTRRNIAEALSICDETPGPVAFMLRSAIINREKHPDVLERAIKDAARTELARMERLFSGIATIAQITPLLGLLGTVIGIIQTHLIIQDKASLVHAGDLSGGIWQALITTAAGLIVAIFSYIAYNMLVSKLNFIVLDMEHSLDEIMGFFTGSNPAWKIEENESLKTEAS